MGANESLPGDGPVPEMHHYYSKFMRECPSGQLSLHEFKKLLGLQGLDPQGDLYIKRVFDIFDLNQVNLLLFTSLMSYYCLWVVACRLFFVICSQNCCHGQGCCCGVLKVKRWDCALWALSRTLTSTFQVHLKNIKKQFWKLDVICSSQVILLLSFAYPVLVCEHIKIFVCANTKLVNNFLFHNNIRQRGKYSLHLTNKVHHRCTDLPKILYWMCGTEENVAKIRK